MKFSVQAWNIYLFSLGDVDSELDKQFDKKLRGFGAGFVGTFGFVACAVAANSGSIAPLALPFALRLTGNGVVLAVDGIIQKVSAANKKFFDAYPFLVRTHPQNVLKLKNGTLIR